MLAVTVILPLSRGATAGPPPFCGILSALLTLFVPDLPQAASAAQHKNARQIMNAPKKFL
jgi:hypothetical protein